MQLRAILRNHCADNFPIGGVKRKCPCGDDELRTSILVQPTSPDSQPWGFIPFEVGIVSAEEQGFQAGRSCCRPMTVAELERVYAAPPVENWSRIQFLLGHVSASPLAFFNTSF